MAENSNDGFLVPGPTGPDKDFSADLTWTLGSLQVIQWSTNLDSYDINLYQQGTDPPPDHQPGTIYSVGSGGAGEQIFRWQVQTYNTNLTFGHVFFLWLAPGDTQGFTSHYFNITDQAQSTSGTSSPTAFASSTSLASSTTAFTSPTSLASSITASSISSTPSQRSSQTPVTPPASASSNTKSLKVGLGVGLGIGIPLVLLAGMWIGLRLVRSRHSSSRSMNPGEPLSQFPIMEYPPDSYPDPSQSGHYGNKVQEAPGEGHEILEAPEGRPLIELDSRDI
ncbi:MAG: hypothetical protein OHK93_008031 [Ramalina farinacea]|uniref:Mid2 domain-containing protein n=1 Tax=Ramalina farinacea TaxID=258253 RepID=A0AA43QLP1_9LECA|nr:hypothetical protein [Ramalina farinacea]